MTPKERKKFGIYRDMIRVALIGLSAALCLIFSWPPDLVIGVIFIMIGWRLKTGW